MKTKLLIIILANLIVISCVPVLREDLMRSGIVNFQLTDIKENPVYNEGKLFILGGIIVKTTMSKEGSLLESIYVPVDTRGYFRTLGTKDGRFLALYRGKELLDPVIYKEKREVTIAGEFIGLRNGMIGEMEYTYPLFEIKEIYLWSEYKDTGYYRYPYYYPYYYPPPYHPYYRYRHYPYYDYPYYPWW
ncbi:MAG: Slp family lipoprotein [Nitrospirae bacterium]|nr:Slp family lipoprotein [Nitrospirota bacterium]